MRCPRCPLGAAEASAPHCLVNGFARSPCLRHGAPWCLAPWLTSLPLRPRVSPACVQGKQGRKGGKKGGKEGPSFVRWKIEEIKVTSHTSCPSLLLRVERERHVVSAPGRAPPREKGGRLPPGVQPALT